MTASLSSIPRGVLIYINSVLLHICCPFTNSLQSVCFSAVSFSIYPTRHTMLTWALNQRWSNVTTLDRRCFESYLPVCLLGTLKLYSLFYLVSCSPNTWLFYCTSVQVIGLQSNIFFIQLLKDSKFNIYVDMVDCNIGYRFTQVERLPSGSFLN